MGPGAAIPSFAHILNVLHPGTIAGETNYPLDIGLLIGLVGAVVYWFLMKRTTLGYEIKAVGQSQKAARYAGISVQRNIIMTMTIAGAFAGVAGALIVMQPHQQLSIKDTFFLYDQTGFNGIIVALLGLNGPIGVVLAGVLFAALNQGANLMQSDAGIFASNAVVGLPNNYSVRIEFIQFAFQAMVLLVIAGQIVPQFRTMQRRLIANFMAGFRSALARLPSLILGLLLLVDGVAVVAFIGFIIVSLVSLQSVVALDATVSAIYHVSLAPLFGFLFVFYVAGILLLLLTVGIRLSGRWRKRAGAASVLVEATLTSEALVSASVILSSPDTISGPRTDEPSDSPS